MFRNYRCSMYLCLCVYIYMCMCDLLSREKAEYSFSSHSLFERHSFQLNETNEARTGRSLKVWKKTESKTNPTEAFTLRRRKVDWNWNLNQCWCYCCTACAALVCVCDLHLMSKTKRERKKKRQLKKQIVDERENKETNRETVKKFASIIPN